MLVSADFLASEFVVTQELPRLLAAAEEEDAVILPFRILCIYQRNYLQREITSLRS